MATIADEIRAAIKDIRGDGLTPEEIYSKCPSATSADQISIHMSAFVKRDEAIRTTVQGRRAGLFRLNSQYRPARGQEEDDNGARLVESSAHHEKEKPGPKTRTAATPGRKPGQKNKAPRPAKKPKAAKKVKTGGKRKYTRRAPPPAASGATGRAGRRPAAVLLRHQRGRRPGHHRRREQDRAQPNRRATVAGIPQHHRAAVAIDLP